MLFGLLLEVKREIGIKKNLAAGFCSFLYTLASMTDPFMIHEDAEIFLFSLIHQFHQAVFSQANHGFSSKLSILDPSPSLSHALQR
jgi:hypothetical protein